MFAGCFDPNTIKYTKDDLLKAVGVIFFAFNYIESIQVNGFVWITDMTGFTLKHQMYFGVNDIKKTITVWQVGKSFIR